MGEYNNNYANAVLFLKLLNLCTIISGNKYHLVYELTQYNKLMQYQFHSALQPEQCSQSSKLRNGM